MTKKIFAMFLAVLMVVSVLPISAMAASDCPGEDKAHTIDNCEYTQVSVVAPTCGKPGFTYYECNDCHTKFIGSPVAATGEHTFEPAEAKPATCEEKGHTAGLKCKDCGELKDCVETPALTKGGKCNWSAWEPAKIDCTVGGVRISRCQNPGCPGEKKDEQKPTKEHNWGEVVLKTAATADANGKAEQKCDNPVCNVKRDVVVYFKHTHVIELYPAIAPTCTEGGMKEYHACRICGVKYTDADGKTEMPEADIKKLSLDPKHAWKSGEPTCKDTTFECSKCGVIPVSVKCDYEKTFTSFSPAAVKPTAATCNYGGFNMFTCKVCKRTYTENVNALGHLAVNVSVPSTCSTFAYTFTYCTRTGCDTVCNTTSATNLKCSFKIDTLSDATLSSAANAKGSYYLGVHQTKLGTDLFFNGVIVDGKLSTTKDVSKAVKVNVEVVHALKENAYRLYIKNAEGGKSYIEIYKTEDGKISVRLSDAVAGEYTVDANGRLQAKVGKKYYTFATYKTADALSVVENEAEKDTIFAVLGTTGVKGDAHVTVFNVNVEGGYNDNGHAYDKGKETTKHDHDNTGIKTYTCTICNTTKTEIVEKGHTFENATGEVEVNGKKVAAKQDATCVDGWQYKVCDCGELKKEVLPGYGHVKTDLIEAEVSCKNPYDYDHYLCVYKDKGCTFRENVGEQKVWGLSNTHWDSVAMAQTEHTISGEGTPVRPETCTVYGLKGYTCSDCKKTVLVKTPTFHDPQHPNNIAASKIDLPECDDEGSYVTFKCTQPNCNTVIGNGVVGVTENTIAKLGHAMVETEAYLKAKEDGLDCAKPDFTLIKAQCANAGCTEKVMAYEKKTEANVTDCTNSSKLVYSCAQCNTYHAQNFPGELGHEMVKLDKKGTHKEMIEGVETDVPNFIDSTCSTAGKWYAQCVFCPKIEAEPVAKKEHINAAGEKFTERCDDEETDRHCVVCCRNAATEHGAKCDMTNCAKVKDEDGNYLCKCMIPNICSGTSVKVPSTCLESAYTLMICDFCGEPKVTFSDLPWNGHKPVTVGTGEGDGKHGNLVYEDEFIWDSIKVVNGEFVRDEENESVKNAEFIEYVPATYAADGYWKGECAICKQVVTQVLPKLTGLGFEMNISNTNGAKDYAFGSLVEVVLSVTGSKTDLHGFTSVLPIEDELKYVGYEVLNKDFNITVTEPAKAEGYVAVVGAANNTLAGKQQNINIDGDVALVKLLFRVVEDEKGEANFDLVVPNAVCLKNGTTESITGARIDSEKIKVRGFLDFDHSSENVGSTETSGNINDLFLAMSLLTGEHPEGKTYDVTVDINKDGVITLEDLSIAYNYAVGNYTDKEIAKMGLSDAEIAILFPAVNKCLRPTCDAEVPVDALYCPVCGFNQK